jgi:hypothetical protein
MDSSNSHEFLNHNAQVLGGGGGKDALKLHVAEAADNFRLETTKTCVPVHARFVAHTRSVTLDILPALSTAARNNLVTSWSL